MKNKSLFFYRLATVLIPCILIFLYIIHDFLITLVKSMPRCIFYFTFHLYCPACGNTRSVTALLHGCFLTSLKYNISPVIFGFFMFLAYIELATYSFGRQLHILPRKLSFYLIIISLLSFYYIVRNFIPCLAP